MWDEILEAVVKGAMSALEKAKSEPGKFLEVEGLLLRGPKGEPRAALYVDEENQPNLAFYDQAEQARVLLSLSEEEPRLFLLDEDGTPRVMLGVGDEEGSNGCSLSLYNREGDMKVWLGENEEETWLTMYDGKAEVSRAWLSVNDEEAGLTFNNPENTQIVWVGADSQESWLALNHGVDGVAQCVLSALEEGAQLKTSDRKGKERTFVLTDKASVLKVLDEEGRVLFAAPGK
jgi:hypothetical protein